MRYFVSDLHFGHKLVHWKYRSHNASISDMNEEIVYNWNKRVKSKDIVYVLGDVSFMKFEETKSIIRKLNGRKILVRGNHDEKFASKEFLDMGFYEVRDTLVIRKTNKVGETEVREKWILSHYPYSSSIKFFWYKIFGKREEAGYYKLYLPYKGYKLLHGHHHAGAQYKFDQVNVAWDVNHKLLSEDEVQAIFDQNKPSKLERLINSLKLIFF